MKEPPSFRDDMDGGTVHIFVHAVDTYFGVIGTINEKTRHKFASLLMIENAANWYER